MTKKSTDQIDFALGKNIQAMRLNKGYTQRQLAERIGVSYQQLQKYENGTNRVTVSMLVRIAGVLGEQPTRFLQAGNDSAAAADAEMLSAEIVDLVRLYSDIKSDQTRRMVHAMLGEMVAKDLRQEE